MRILKGPAIYAEQGVLKDQVIVIHDSLIQDIVPASSTFSHDADILSFPENFHVIPGFIDLHVHGAKGIDVMDDDPHALTQLAETLARQGTTSFLATTMTAPVNQIECVLKRVHHLKDKTPAGAEILGVHLEGPFLSGKKAGAQDKNFFLLPEKKYLMDWQRLSDNAIKLITLAPELPGSIEFIRYATEQNIVVSQGHTDATYAESFAAIKAGCRHATHLFNAMRNMHHREPGPAIAALLSDDVSVELIVDGVHVHPAMIDFVFKSKGKDKIILVSDAMCAACLGDGSYHLGNQAVEVKNQIATLQDGTLAGSTLTFSSIIQNMKKFTNCHLHDIIKMTAENPAKLLNIFDRKGSIARGKEADLVVLDEGWNVVGVVCRGQAFSCEL